MNSALNRLVDNVYILNLEKDRFKYDILAKKLKELNIEHERFIGVDGYGREHREVLSKSPSGDSWYCPRKVKENRKEMLNHYRGLEIYETLEGFSCGMHGGVFRSPGAMGCLLSHIKILEDALKKNYEKVMLVQDDVYFHEYFEARIEELSQLIESSDAFYLGASQHQWMRWREMGFDHEGKAMIYKPNSRTFGLFGLIISKEVAEKAVKLMKYYCLPADQCVALTVSHNFLDNSYVSYPNLIIADTAESRTWEPGSLHTQFRRPLEGGHAKKMRWKINEYDLKERYYK